MSFKDLFQWAQFLYTRLYQVVSEPGQKYDSLLGSQDFPFDLSNMQLPHPSQRSRDETYTPYLTLWTNMVTNYMHHPRLNIKRLCPYSLFIPIYFVRFVQQRTTIFLNSNNTLFFSMETQCVFCEVRTELLYFRPISCFKRLNAGKIYRILNVKPSLMFHAFWNASIKQLEQEILAITNRLLLSTDTTRTA
jgi:hypothetical protein